MWNRVAVLASVAFMAGCAPSSVIELRQQSEPVEFSVNQPYQRVSKNIKEELERYISAGFLFASTTINSQIYPDLGEAEISVTNYNMGDQSAFVDIQITGNAESAHVIARSAALGSWRGAAHTIKDCVVYEKPYCD